MTPIQIILIVAVALAAVAYLIHMIRREEKQQAARRSMQVELRKEWDEGPYQPDYNIAGINKYGLTVADCGLARGWVMRDKENRHDKNAVAVFRNETHVGYLNKEIAKEFAPKLDEIGKAVPCLLSIRSEVDEGDGHQYFVGRVRILWPATE